MRIVLPVCLLLAVALPAAAQAIDWKTDDPAGVVDEIRTSGKPGVLMFVTKGKTDKAVAKLMASLAKHADLQSLASRAIWASFETSQIKTGQRFKFRSWRIQLSNKPALWIVDTYGKIRKRWTLEKADMASLHKELKQQVDRAPAKKAGRTLGSRRERGRTNVPFKKKGRREETVTFDGKPYTYWVRVPSTYNARTPHKTIILCHGNGDKAENFLRIINTQAGGEASKWLWLSLEKCDNLATGSNLIPKYITALKKVYNFASASTFMISFSGGGFRTWREVVSKEDEMRRLRGVALFGCGASGGSPPSWKPGIAKVTVIGDPKDPNYTQPGRQAVSQLKKRKYEPRNREHNEGHRIPTKELELTIDWFTGLMGKR